MVWSNGSVFVGPVEEIFTDLGEEGMMLPEASIIQKPIKEISPDNCPWSFQNPLSTYSWADPSRLRKLSSADKLIGIERPAELLWRTRLTLKEVIQDWVGIDSSPARFQETAKIHLYLFLEEFILGLELNCCRRAES